MTTSTISTGVRQRSGFFSSTIGKKLVMALTGAMLIGFLLGHLLGNLQLFAGQDTFNAYAAFLKSIPGPLWVARIGILTIFLLHLFTAFTLRQTNAQARPTKYRNLRTVQADPASLYMLETGILILIFVVIHILHFTLGVLEPDKFHFVDPKGRHDVYSMVVLGFQSGPYAMLYIGAMIALGFHLAHAVKSMFQTLGILPTSCRGCIRTVSFLFGALIALSYCSIPLAVMCGIIRLP